MEIDAGKAGEAPDAGLPVSYAEDRVKKRTQLRLSLSGLPIGEKVVDLEIGCGHGHFLTSYAEANPLRFCLGIDLSGARIARARRKKKQSGGTNLTFHQCEARDLLDSLPTGCRFSRIFILFPDPWPKRKHHKNRLVRAEFLHDLSLVSGRSATLYLRTDHIGYWEEMNRLIETSTDWQRDDEVCWPPIRETVFQNRADRFFSAAARLCVTEVPGR